MLPRYSLYGSLEDWKGSIEEDPGGRWVRWKDVAPYLAYCQAHGFVVKPEVIDPLQGKSDDYDDYYEDIIITEDDDHEVPLDDGEDVYDLLTKHEKEVEDDHQ